MRGTKVRRETSNATTQWPQCKRSVFAAEYIKDHNGARATRAAGTASALLDNRLWRSLQNLTSETRFARKAVGTRSGTTRQQARTLPYKTKHSKRDSREAMRLQRALDVSVQRIARELEKVAFADITGIAKWGPAD